MAFPVFTGSSPARKMDAKLGKEVEKMVPFVFQGAMVENEDEEMEIVEEFESEENDVVVTPMKTRLSQRLKDKGRVDIKSRASAIGG